MKQGEISAGAFYLNDSVHWFRKVTKIWDGMVLYEEHHWQYGQPLVGHGSCLLKNFARWATRCAGVTKEEALEAAKKKAASEIVFQPR